MIVTFKFSIPHFRKRNCVRTVKSKVHIKKDRDHRQSQVVARTIFYKIYIKFERQRRYFGLCLFPHFTDKLT